MTFAQHMQEFIRDLHFSTALPPEIEVMDPFTDPVTLSVCDQFYDLFYADTHHRWMIIGINPGRFGGGVTGIPFTDPVRLETICGIQNPWPKKQELSSVFIYNMIQNFGGPKDFYQKFYITAVSPLGFTRHGKNLNYYDDKQLQAEVTPFAVDCLNRQLNFGIHRNVAFCLGDGKNFKYLDALNKKMKFFDQVVPLPHPRFIMQYRLKKKEDYIRLYLDRFSQYCV
jgi:hypothetical protein